MMALTLEIVGEVLFGAELSDRVGAVGWSHRWSLHPVPGHPVEPQPAVTLRPRHGIRMIARRR